MQENRNRIIDISSILLNLGLTRYFQEFIIIISGWDDFDPAELSYKEQVTMARLLQENGHKIIVLDAHELLEDPGRSDTLIIYFCFNPLLQNCGVFCEVYMFVIVCL